MKPLSASRLAIAVAVALAMGPALANTDTTRTTDKGMDRATPAQSENANVTTGQNAQDKNNNALDANAKDSKKVSKAKKAKKDKVIAKTESEKASMPQ